MDTKTVLDLIAQERERQTAKWGTQQHDHGTWLLIVQEELGEVAEVILQGRGWQDSEFVPELIQAAAVIVAWIEDYTSETQVEYLKRMQSRLSPEEYKKLHLGEWIPPQE